MTEMGSLEFASLSPASNIRQRVKWSMGEALTDPADESAAAANFDRPNFVSVS
ncbi:MAG TPA: hypothetical protein VMI52_09280 [Acetobacteraceae bacterium]|nr:hypothetical protein [Acetobacteraceae bacterium]